MKIKWNRENLLTVALVLACSIITLSAYASLIILNTSFSREKYSLLLEELRDEGYIAVLPRDFYRDGIRFNKTLIIVHDVDVRFSGMKLLSEVEDRYQVKSGFFLRPSTSYFSYSIYDFKDLEERGWEIGYHYSALSQMDENYVRAQDHFTNQLQYLRSYFDITTVRGHGDSYNLSIANTDLSKLPGFFSSLGVWEATFPEEEFTYIRDTDGTIVIPRKNTWKDLIILNFHSDYW